MHRWSRRLVVIALCAGPAQPALAGSRPSRQTAGAPGSAVDTAIKRTGPLSYEIDVPAAGSALKMSSLTRSARIVPEIRDGKGIGLRLQSVEPDGVLARLGLQGGDVVRAVDGVVIDSPEVALAVYEKSRAARQVSVELERQGRPLTLRYRLRR